MKKGISLGIVLCMLLMLMSTALPAFADDEGSVDPFAFVSASTTTTDFEALGIVEQYECTTNSSANQERMALEYITDAELSYTYDLGDKEASGMEILLGIMWDGQGSTITAYKVVDGVKTKIGSYTTEAEYYWEHYRRYFISFNDGNLTGSGTLILEFNNDNAQNPNEWIGFSGYNFIDASQTSDAFSELNQKTSYQISGPDNDSGAWDGEGYGWFGDGGLGDYITITNVDFGETGAAGMSFYWSTGSDTKVTADTSIKIFYGGADGTEVLSLGYDDLKDIQIPVETLYTFTLDKAIPAGVHNIYIRVKNFQANFRYCQFAKAKDGTQKISAATYDSDQDGNGIGKYDDGHISHIGWNTGEKVIYNFINFGEKAVRSLDFSFEAWSGDGDKTAGEDSRLEVYLDSVSEEGLIDTLTYDELSTYAGTGYHTYSIILPESLTGIHTVIFCSYWQGAMEWFKFNVAKDGSKQILAVDFDNGLDGSWTESEDGLPAVVRFFGRYYTAENRIGEVLDYNLVDFGDKQMLSMDIRFNAWSDADAESKEGKGKLEVYADDTLIATVPFEELSNNINHFATYTVDFDEPLTGVHDISIKSYWQGAMSWFRFNAAKDGAQKILAVDYDDYSGDGYGIRENEDNMERIMGWFGNEDGEKTVYNLVDFADKEMKSMDIRFSAWNDSSDASKGGAGKIEVYAGDDLIATVPYAELNANRDRFTTYTIYFAEPLTDVSDIAVVSYWQGALSWIQFKEDGKDGLGVAGASVNTDNGAVSAAVYRYLNVVDSQTVTVIFACYDENNKLLATTKAEAITASDITTSGKPVAATFTDTSKLTSAKTLKVFVWDTQENMVPLAAEIVKQAI